MKQLAQAVAALSRMDKEANACSRRRPKLTRYA